MYMCEGEKPGMRTIRDKNRAYVPVFVRATYIYRANDD